MRFWISFAVSLINSAFEFHLLPNGFVGRLFEFLRVENFGIDAALHHFFDHHFPHRLELRLTIGADREFAGWRDRRRSRPLTL